MHACPSAHVGTALVLVLSIAVSAPARAQDSPAVAEARQRFDIAQRAFERGEYASALTEWEQVYALLEGHPNRAYVIFNIARTNQELGRDREALREYERFLAEAPADAPNRADAQRLARELRLRLALDRGQPGSLSVSPIGLVIAGVGVAAAIGGGIVGGIALGQDGGARADCVGTSCTPEAYAAIGDAGVLANVADALLWGGLAIAAAGAVLAFVLGESSVSASAACDADGCAALVRGRL